MKGKSRKRNRRYSGKRRNLRNRSKITVVLVILFIIAVVIASVFLGKYLKKKAEISEQNRLNEKLDTVETENKTDGDEESILSHVQPPERISATYLPHEEIASFVGDDDKSYVSLIMRDAKGELKYFSPIAQSLGIQSGDVELPLADELIGKLKGENCYTSVFVAHSGHGELTGAEANAIQAFEGALFFELATAGADEIILCGFEDMDGGRIDALCELSKNYRGDDRSSVPLGIALPYSFFATENANELCRKLYEHFEIMIVDYTDAVETEEKSLSDIFSERVETMQMYFSRYSLRVLIDDNSADFSEIEALLADMAIYSVQSVARKELFVLPDSDA